jgi:D-tyrosyl-tRNA(Tyr) deacylase
LKALLQRVTSANVEVDGERIAAIGRGLLVFLGVERDDTRRQGEQLLDRIIRYRVFSDSDGRMNLDLDASRGALLVVPQFTLAADTRKGRRPSFSNAADPELGQALFDQFVALGRERLGDGRLQSGRFAADMQVGLVNDGPVTFWLEAAPLRPQ